jgi:uncharacterized protein
MERPMKGIILSALVLLLGACSGRSSPPDALSHLPSLSGDYFALQSKETQRPYHIYVRLPPGYDAAKGEAYPVVYVLDGDSLFPLLSSTHLFLHNDEQIPEAILVGIGYGSFEPEINKRDLDFAAEGAPKFLAFLKTELMPRIERQYKVDAARRALIGQSRAGYFVLWQAIEDPSLFWASIASNTSIPSEREALFRAPSATPDGPGQARVAVISGTRDTEERLRNGTDWVRHWASRPGAPWAVRQFVIEGGTHAASIGQAYRDVMVWLFKDWVDHSPHQISFVEVEQGVRLEVLDWGGRGRDVVLLAGLGNTAHTFDTFAPRLAAANHRVIAITRRGYAPSDVPEGGYDPDRLADDIARVVDRLDLKSPILIGHSIASEELNAFAARHPARVAGLVYLDAAYDRSPATKSLMSPLERKLKPPRPTSADLTDRASVERWLHKVRGLALPEAEERRCCEFDGDGKFVRFLSNASPAADKIFAGIRAPNYSQIHVPALAFFAVMRSMEDFSDHESQDPAALQAYLQGWQSVQRQQIERLNAELKGSRVVELPGANHHVYASNERDVLREIDLFSREIDAAQAEQRPPRVPGEGSVSRELAPVLKRAQDALKHKQWDEALAALDAAESTPGKTAFDQTVIDAMRTSARLNLQRQAGR